MTGPRVPGRGGMARTPPYNVTGTPRKGRNYAICWDYYYNPARAFGIDRGQVKPVKQGATAPGRAGMSPGESARIDLSGQLVKAGANN